MRSSAVRWEKGLNKTTVTTIYKFITQLEKPGEKKKVFEGSI